MKSRFPLRYVIAMLVCAPIAQAEFSYVGTVTLSGLNNYHGIAFDGLTIDIVDSDDARIGKYDGSFNFIETIPISGVGRITGLTQNSINGTLYLGDWDSGTVVNIHIGGTVLGSFGTSLPALNGLAFDPTDGTLWLADFGGEIQHRSVDGTLLDSFVLPQQWTGLTIDPYNQVLFGLGSGVGDLDDRLYEIPLDGSSSTVLLGGVDVIAGNGMGLSYVADSGNLFVTSQEGNLAIYQDITIPEPSSVLLFTAAICLSALVRRKVL